MSTPRKVWLAFIIAKVLAAWSSHGEWRALWIFLSLCSLFFFCVNHHENAGTRAYEARSRERGRWNG